MEWPLLRSLPEEDRRKVLAAARRRRFARREVLFHEGDPGDTLHLVSSGRVAVRITTPLGDVATVAVRGPGEVVGELALLDEAARRTATAIAIEQTETLSLHRDAFFEIRRLHPAVDRFLAEMLAAQLRQTTVHLVEALFVPADRRVIRRLVALADAYGGVQREIPVTQEDLASLAGTSRATVNRVLGEIQALGAIALGRGRITVLDLEKLSRLGR